jgi:hypothetical protein
MLAFKRFEDTLMGEYTPIRYNKWGLWLVVRCECGDIEFRLKSELEEGDIILNSIGAHWVQNGE